MRGHEPLLRMRQAGKRPVIVFINDWPCATDWSRHGDHATVCTDGDDIELLDLRFVLGLRVSISSTSEERARALFESCKAAGACMVGAVHLKENAPAWAQDGWAEVWLAGEAAHG